MNTQLELIPLTKQIPQWLADYFYKANAGNYRYKQSFYSDIKNPVLEKYAEFIGYEMQVIEYPCNSCDGDGKFKHYHYEDGRRYLIKTEPCWHCTNGIYQIRKFTLKKYVLNGVIYHIPGDFNPYVRHLSTVIKGRIEHEPVDSSEALNAYLILLWWYNKRVFYYRMKTYLELRIKSVSELVQKLVRKDNTNDDLPF